MAEAAGLENFDRGSSIRRSPVSHPAQQALSACSRREKSRCSADGNRLTSRLRTGVRAGGEAGTPTPVIVFQLQASLVNTDRLAFVAQERRRPNRIGVLAPPEQATGGFLAAKPHIRPRRTGPHPRRAGPEGRARAVHPTAYITPIRRPAKLDGFRDFECRGAWPAGARYNALVAVALMAHRPSP
jgi:hypothetical protein